MRKALFVFALLLPACESEVQELFEPPRRADLRLEGGWTPERRALVEHACHEWNRILSSDRRCTISPTGKRTIRLEQVTIAEVPDARLTDRDLTLSYEASDRTILTASMLAIGHYSGIEEDTGHCTVLSRDEQTDKDCRLRLTARDYEACVRAGACE